MRVLFQPSACDCLLSGVMRFRRASNLISHGRLARWRKWRACDVGEAKKGLENELWRRWSDGKLGEWAELSTKHWVELILQPFRHITYITAHFPTLLSLHLRHNSFSNPSVALPMSQLILQPFRRFTYVTTHSPTLPSLYLRHSSFSNLSVALPTPQLILQPLFHFSYVTGSSLTSPEVQYLILQPFRHFTYVTAHSPTFPLLYLRHSSFSNSSFASPTSRALHLIHLASRPYFFDSSNDIF